METIELSKDGKKFWQTKKKSVMVSFTSDPVELYGAYWSGGSRNEWYTVGRNGEWKGLPSVGPTPFDTRPVPKVAPQEGLAIVCLGVFCGKPATPHIYLTDKEEWIF